MKFEISTPYEPITEKEYCCVPAVLQMLQIRRGLNCLSQDEIGYQLGLIVPDELEYLYDRVRTGAEPKAGYGTQTSKKEFSISNYFERNNLPLRIENVRPRFLDELSALLASSIRRDCDVIVCYNSKFLFGDGDIKHVSLIQTFESDTGQVLLIDPAIAVPKHRLIDLERLFEVLSQDDVSDHGGLWIISEVRRAERQCKQEIINDNFFYSKILKINFIHHCR